MAVYRHSPHTRRSLAAMARVACPPDIDELGLVDEVVDHVELSMQSLPAAMRAGLLAGLETYEQAARLVPAHRGRPASALPPERARRYFDSWRKSRLFVRQQFIQGLGGLLCLAYYETPAAKQQLGYTPEEWIERVDRHRRETYAADIRRHAESLIAPDSLSRRKHPDKEAS